MFIDLSRVSLFVKPGPTDMRKGAHGLSVLVSEAMELDVLSGSLFMFCSRNRKLLKAIYWDGTGFWMLQKKLEGTYRFPWPKQGEGSFEMNEQQLRMLLSGINFWEAHQRLEYSSVV